MADLPVGGGNVVGVATARLTVDPSGVARGIRSAQRDFDRGTMQMARNMRQRMNEISQSVTQVATQMAPLSLAAGGLFVAGIRSASSFQAKLVEIQARSGATAEAIEQLDDTITQQAANTVFNAEQIGNAYLFALTSGQSLTEALANMPAVLDLAAAGGLDVSRAMDIATNIIAQFNETVEVTPMIVEALNAAAGASPATIGEIGEAFTNAGNVAKVFGLDIQTTSEILATFARSGIRGAEAGTLLRSMLSFMTRDTEATTGAWADLGVRLFNTQGEMRDLDDVFSEVADAMELVNEQERIQLSRDIAGRYGLQGFNALVAARGLGEMREEMAGVAKAGDVAAARMNTFDQQLQSLMGSVDALLKEAFTPLLEDVLTPLLKQLIETTNTVRDFAEANPELMTTLTGVIGLVALAAPALFALGFALKGAALAAGGLGIALTLATGPVGWLIAAIGALAAAVATDLGGIGSAVSRFATGISGLLGDVISEFTGMNEVLDDLDGKQVDVKVGVEREGETVDDLVDVETDVSVDVAVSPNYELGDWTPKSGDNLYSFWQAAQSETGLSWDQFKNLVADANPGLNLSVIQAGVPITVPMAVVPDAELSDDAMIQTVIGIYTGLRDAADEQIEEQEVGTRLGEFLGERVAGIIRDAVAGLRDVRRFLLGGNVQIDTATLAEGIELPVEVYQTGIIDAVADAIFGAPDEATGLIDRAKAFIGQVETDIDDFVTAFGAGVRPALRKMGGEVRQLVNDAMARIETNFADFPEWFQENVVDRVSVAVGDISGQVRGLVEGFFANNEEVFADFPAWLRETVIWPVRDRIVEFFGTDFGKIITDAIHALSDDTGGFEGAAASLGEFLGNAVSTIIQGAIGAIAFVGDLALQVVGGINDALFGGDVSFGDWILGVLNNVFYFTEGLWRGLKTPFEPVVAAIEEWLTGAIDDFTASIEEWWSDNIAMPVADFMGNLWGGLERIIFGDPAITGNVQTAGVSGNVFRQLVANIADIPATLRSAGDTVSSVLGDWQTAFADAFEAIFGVSDGEERTGLLGMIWAINDGIVGAITGASEAIGDPLERIANGFLTMGNFISDIINTIIGIINGMVSAAREAAEYLAEAFGIGGGGGEASAPVFIPPRNPGGSPASQFEYRDAGGFGMAGRGYMIGAGAQPELFVPRTDGQFIPNIDRLLAGAGNTTININVTPQINPAAGPLDEQMDYVTQRVERELRAQGVGR